MSNITLFGTCRINSCKNNNNLNNMINYTHCTKEILQMIHYIRNDIIIPSPFNQFCFRTGIISNSSLEYDKKFAKILENSDVCVLEICSNKKYIHSNYLLHHLCVDNRTRFWGKNTTSFIKDGFHIEKQSDEEIENDILKIKELLFPKKIIIVSHYNAKINNEPIKSRLYLINLLETICNKHHIRFVNPSMLLNNYTQTTILDRDLGHYTDFGLEIFNKHLDNIIEDVKVHD